MSPQETFQLITSKIDHLQTQKNKPIRLAINGIEGTGKTVFAENLTKYLQEEYYKAIHVSIDGFHFNKATRYRQGRDSAKGYYEDAYNELAFVEKVLIASQQEPPTYIPAIHNLETDKYINLDSVTIDNQAIIITDGAYLLKPIYRPHWDLTIYLKTDFQTAMQRAIQRDSVLLGGFKKAKDKYLHRYHKAARMYLEACEPEHFANLIIDNTDFNALRILKND